MLSITFDRFTLGFGARTLFKAMSGTLDWSVDRTGIIGLMGPSGSGKTTLLNSLLEHRYLHPHRGIGLDPGQPSIGHVPQQPVLFAHESTTANARLFQKVGRYRAAFDEVLFTQLVETLRLRSVLGHGRVDRLSGGEAQRLMLLRTLSVRPDLLLLDEPCAGLDAGVRAAFLADLGVLIRRLGICALYVGHHWEEIESLAGQIAYLRPTGPDDSIQELSVCSSAAMIEAPPTPDAFQAIFGPRSGLWPAEIRANGQANLLEPAAIADAIDTQVIACIKPSASEDHWASPETFGPFRRCRGSRQVPTEAHLYQSDRFLGIFPLMEASS